MQQISECFFCILGSMNRLTPAILITSLLFCLCSISVAQQPVQYSQYMLNRYSFNPAYAGFDLSLSVTASYRNQWSGLTGNPKSQNLNAHLPLYKWNGAVGIQFQNDGIGAESSISASASYNYVYQAPVGLFSIGLRVGILQKKLDGSKLISPDGIYEGTNINHNDPILAERSVSGVGPIWSFGGYYIHDVFETGISIGRVPTQFISLGNSKIELSPLATFYFEYLIPVNEFLELSPSILLKSDFVQTQLDIGVNASYDNIIGGIGFRGYNANSVDAIILIAGLQINSHYRLSYSYDFGLSALSNVHEGTHEVVLNYNLNKLIGVGKPEKIIYNPRFL